VAPLPDAPELGELELGLLELAPPEAEPELDFDGSVALGELDELPPEGEVAEDEELEPDGGVDGVALLLELPLVLPLLPADLPVPLSWPQAARPKARATAAANVESFMCPPWLGIRKNAARNGPGRKPLNTGL
jgi:hypothetical protein